MKNNKGVTLISLAIMIVVLIILASIGMNYNSNSIKLARLTKFTTEIELINIQLSILNQNKNYKQYENYGLNATSDAELITEIDTLLEDKLVNIYKVDEADVEAYINRFQYCTKANINEKLGVDGIEGNYLVNIQNRIVISFDGIKYDGKWYYTLEELEKDELATNTYKVEYHEYENPYMPKGHYYVGGTWDTGYVISDSLDDKYTEKKYRELTTAIAETCTGNLYMWIPIVEKDANNTSGVNWSFVTSKEDHTNIQVALDAYKATYSIPDYSSEWYADVTFGQYMYSNSKNKLVEYPAAESSEDDKNNILTSIYSNGGLYVKISF